MKRFLFLAMTALSLSTWAAEIHEAAADGNLEKVRILILADPTLVNLKDKSSSTPLHEAARKGHTAVVELLLASKADVNARDSSGLTPLKLATGYGRKETAELLQKNGGQLTATPAPAVPATPTPTFQPAPPATGFTADIPINIAAKAGDLEKVKALLLADPQLANATNSRGITPLQLAASQGHQPVVELLLANKADVNARATNGWSALLAATGKTNLAVVELLLAKKAEVNVANNYGQTPLLGAAGKRSWPIAKALLAAKADPNAVDKYGSTALLRFVSDANQEAVAGLLAAGANPNVKDKMLNVTALHYAAGRGDQPMAELLIAHKADLNVEDEDGFTPLSHALLTDHAALAAYLKQKGAIEAPEKPLAEPQRSLVEAIKKFDTTLRQGTKAEQLKEFFTMEPTAADLAKIFGANAAKAGQIVAKEKQRILAEVERESPAPKEGEIIRVLPKEPTLLNPKLIAAGLPLNSIMIVRKGGSSQGDTVYCYVNEHWVRLPSLYEFDSGFQEMERRFPSR